MKVLLGFIYIIILGMAAACSSPSNDRGLTIDELEKAEKDATTESGPGPTKDALSAKELIALADCKDLMCVQLFMKNHSTDFVHAKKGEFAALHRSVVVDTSGKELIMPLSTLYVDVNPQASWRMAHTLHRRETAEKLINEFQQLGYVLQDSGYYRGMKGKQYRYLAVDIPGKQLFYTTTFQPWSLKGLYNKVSWPCYVFEIR